MSFLPPQLEEFTRQVPVDLNKVAEKLGLKIFSSEKLPPDISGMLVRDEKSDTKSGFVIYVNSKESAARQRFTAAHEIGHFLLHRESVGHGIKDNFLLRSPGMSNKQEVEANKFAAELLMPMDLVARHVESGTNTPKALAKAFGVSEVAMSIRLNLPT